jgi:hypothetical protein
VARLKEAQSVLSGEAAKVRQQLREAKESAENAADIGLGSRAVADEAQFAFSICEIVQGQVNGARMREKLKCFLAPLFDPAIISNAVVEGNLLLWRGDLRFMCCSSLDC